MNDTMVYNEMNKRDQKHASEIIPIIASVLNSEKQSISKLSRKTKTLGNSVKDETMERYIKLIMQIQEIFQNKKVCFREVESANRLYKSAWIEEI